jgi:hypothetical protein
MTPRQKSISAGAFLGVIAGTATALVVMRFVPEVGHPVRFGALSRDTTWALFFSSPFGVLVGVASSAYLFRRGHTDVPARRAILETMVLTSLCSAAALQVAIPVAWGIPRGETTAIVAGSAFVLTFLSSVILWPLCRRVAP